jgi:uncharacterized protein YoaH (UPF0181 family)
MVLSVYCGYVGEFDSLEAVVRILEEMSGEYSSGGGVAAIARVIRHEHKRRVGCNIGSAITAVG